MIAGYFHKGTIIISENLDKTHPLSPPNSVTTHAECAALRNVKYGDGGKIYIYREHKDGTSAFARPCSACEMIIKSRGISTVIYSTENGFCKEKYL